MVPETGRREAEDESTFPAVHLTGSRSQVEWAGHIRMRVAAEFDRVAAAFRLVATTQDEDARSATEAVIAILEGKRAEVLRNPDAGYFIRDWQDISDQVRRMVLADPRYAAIRITGRRCAAATTSSA